MGRPKPTNARPFPTREDLEKFLEGEGWKNITVIDFGRNKEGVKLYKVTEENLCIDEYGFIMGGVPR